MHIVVCLDDRNGILFNSRRLSADTAVCQRIFAQHSGRLMMNSYSAKLFPDMDIYVSDTFLEQANVSDSCFVENLDFLNHMSSVASIIVYRWNRHYPSDVKLPEQVLFDWTLQNRVDFAGNSHKIITEERYVR